MKDKLCFECDKPADVEHHVVPKVKGGTRIVFLCHFCHGLVHDMNIKSLSKYGKKKRLEQQKIEKKVVKLFQDKISVWNIAKKMKLRWDSVKTILFNNNLINFKQDDDNEIVKLFKSGMSKNKISKVLNITRHVVYRTLEQYGIHKNTGRGCEIKFTPQTVEQIKKLREKGYSWQRIINQLQLSKTHLYRHIKKYDWYDGKYINKYRDKYRTLTPEIKTQVIELREQGKSWKEIGQKFGIDRGTFYKHGLNVGRENKVRNTMTNEAKIEISKLKKQGMSLRQIADKLNFGLNTLYKHGCAKL